MTRKTQKVISTDNLPMKAPWLFTLLMVCFYNQFKIDFMGGIFFALTLIVWIIWIKCKVSRVEEQIDIFKNENNQQQ
jgi:hypothetical protein